MTQYQSPFSQSSIPDPSILPPTSPLSDPAASPSVFSQDTPEPTAFDYLSDLPRGFASGVEGFTKGIAGLADKASEGLFNYDLINDETLNSHYFKTRTFVGDIVDNATQFGLGFIPALGIAGKIGLAGKVGATVAGAVASFVGFNEHEERLSNLIEKYPALQNPITNFLAAKPDDNWAEGRLKNALEGLGLGVAQDVLMAGLRGFKGMAGAVKAGDESAFKAASETAGKDVEQALAKTGEESTTNPTSPTQASFSKMSPDIQGLPKGVTDTTLGAEKSLDVATKLTDTVRQYLRDGDSVVDAGMKGVQTHLNYTLRDLPKQGEDILKLTTAAVEDAVKESVGGVLSLKDTQDLAERLAAKYPENASTLRMVATDAGRVKGLGVRLVSYEVHENDVLDRLSTLITKEGITPDNLETVTGTLKYLGEIHTSIATIQTEGARIPSLQRIMAGRTKANIDVALDAADKAAKGQFGPAQQKQLAVMLQQAGSDPSVFSRMLKLYESVGSSAVRKGVNAVSEFWINALLSGVPHFVADIAGNAANLVLMPAERIVGGAVMADAAQMKQGFRLLATTVSSAADIFKGFTIADGALPTPLTAFAKSFWSGKPVLDGFTRLEGATEKAISAASLGMQGRPGGVGGGCDWYCRQHPH